MADFYVLYATIIDRRRTRLGGGLTPVFPVGWSNMVRSPLCQYLYSSQFCINCCQCCFLATNRVTLWIKVKCIPVFLFGTGGCLNRLTFVLENIENFEWHLNFLTKWVLIKHNYCYDHHRHHHYKCSRVWWMNGWRKEGRNYCGNNGFFYEIVPDQ